MKKEYIGILVVVALVVIVALVVTLPGEEKVSRDYDVNNDGEYEILNLIPLPILEIPQNQKPYKLPIPQIYRELNKNSFLFFSSKFDLIFLLIDLDPQYFLS